MRRRRYEQGEVAHCKIDALALCAQQVPYRCSALVYSFDSATNTRKRCFADVRALACPQKALADFALRFASILQAASYPAAKVLAREPQAASRTVGRCARLPPDAARSAAIGKTHLCGSVISESSTTLERIQIEIRS